MKTGKIRGIIIPVLVGMLLVMPPSIWFGTRLQGGGPRPATMAGQSSGGTAFQRLDPEFQNEIDRRLNPKKTGGKYLELWEVWDTEARNIRLIDLDMQAWKDFLLRLMQKYDTYIEEMYQDLGLIKRLKHRGKLPQKISGLNYWEK